MTPKAPDFTPLVWAFVTPLLKLAMLMLIGAAILGAIVYYLKKQGFNFALPETDTPYYQKKPLTDTEQILYHRLVEALPGCVILAQVQICSIIGVNRIKAGDNFYKWFNPIAQQSVDFLVCLKDFTIVAAIELDDKSHWGKKSEERDAKKDRNLKAAGIALIRWHAESMPTIEKIRQAFLAEENKETPPPPPKREPTQTNPPTAGLNDFGRLVMACFGDKAMADSLMAFEYEKAPSINNEEAARRAIEKLERPSGT